MKRISYPIVLSCFFISGMCGLVYETVWARMLTLIFGNTTYAYSTVLAAFMVGMALGSFILGRYIDGKPYHLRIYGIMELGIGAYAIILPVLLQLHRYLGFLYRPESNFYLSNGVLFLFCFAMLLIPTMLMGGTLPVLSIFFVRNFTERGSKIGFIYALNTFGAVAGAFATGYFFMYYFGVKGTFLFAAALNVAIGAVCILLDRDKAQPPVADHRDVKQPASVQSRNTSRNLVLAAFALSGFTAMFYEIAWTRVLSLILGSSTYAFSLMLTTFLLGLALGAYLCSLYLRSRPAGILHLAGVELVIGIACLLTIPLFNEMTYWSYAAHLRWQDSFAMLHFIEFLMSMSVMLLPTIMFGATLPLVASLFTVDPRKLGSEVGTVYFWNTIGSTAGSITVGFLSIPVIGIRNSIVLAAVINIAIGVILILRTEQWLKRRWCLLLMIAALAAVTASFTFGLNTGLLTKGVFLRQQEVMDRKQFMKSAKNDIVFYREGVSAVVSVHRSDYIYLRINGKIDASTRVDMATQVFCGHLPFLCNPRLQYGNVAVIGMGSGVTAAVVAKHPLSQVYQIEIEPAVVQAGEYFKDYNLDVLHNPKVKTVIADGRHFIRSFDGQFDVIISEPSNPWMAGIGNLFSQDFYKIAYAKLSEDGTFCQWVQGYNISPELFKVVLKTFSSVFPNTTLWFSQPGDLLLIGRKDHRGTVAIEYQKYMSYLRSHPAVARDMLKIGLARPYGLNATYLFTDRQVREFAGSARLNTDDKPILEYLAPRDLYITTSEDLLRQLYLIYGNEVFIGAPTGNAERSADLLSMAQFYHLRRMLGHAQYFYEKSIQLNPRFDLPWLLMARLYIDYKDFESAEEYLLEAKKHIITPQLNHMLGMLYMQQNKKNKAIAEFQILYKKTNDKKAKQLIEQLKKEQ